MSALRGRAFLGLVRAEARAFWRDRVSLFFTIVLPFLFIVVFGLVMGGGEGAVAVGYAGGAVAEGATLERALRETEGIVPTPFGDAASLKRAVEGKRVGFGVLWEGDRLGLLYEASRFQENFAFQELARGIVARFDLARQGASPAVALDEIPLGNPAAARSFNEMVPGILAFSLLTAGLFAVSGHLTSMKARRTLDRLLTTPMSPLGLLLAVAVVRLAVALSASLVVLVLSQVLFRFEPTLDLAKFLALVLAATLGMMGLGTGIALLVRRPQSAANVANIVSILMMFLSGVTIPVELLPPFLRAISRGLPLTYLAQGMRHATGIEEMSAGRFWAIVLGSLLVGLVTFPLLARYVVRPERR
jgi:ABC-2 type transport system permease protein